MVVEGGLGAEAEDDDEDGTVGADVRDGGELFEAGVVGGGEAFGEVCTAAFGSTYGPTGEAIVGAGGLGGWVEVRE